MVCADYRAVSLDRMRPRPPLALRRGVAAVTVMWPILRPGRGARLAVQVQRCGRDRPARTDQSGSPSAHRSPSRLTIAAAGRRQRRVAEADTAHGAHLLLELAGARRVERPVPAVVRARRELVDEQPIVDDEHLDGQHADVVERVGDLRRRARRRRGACERHDGAVEDPVDVRVVRRRVDRGLAVGAAGEHDGDLAVERAAAARARTADGRAAPTPRRARRGESTVTCPLPS